VRALVSLRLKSFDRAEALLQQTSNLRQLTRAIR
jgi:hypothetical protein